MSVRKKFFTVTAIAMLMVLVFSYFIIYSHLYHTSYNRMVVQQKTAVELNLQLTNSFVESVHRTAIQVVSDQALGDYLSTPGDNHLSMLRHRESLRLQFTHYSAHQAIDSPYDYKNILYLSDRIPIASVFENYTLDYNPKETSSVVFSNTNVKEQEWYQKTVEHVFYVFYNENSNEFCIARRLNNNYYRGPSIPEGQAVLVVCVATDQLNQVFSTIPITANSGYALIGQDKSILFCSNPNIDANIFSEAYAQYQNSRTEDAELKIDGKTYLFSHRPANYGIELLFLVPHSDISADIFPIMKTYSLLFLGITLLTLIVIYILAQRLTKPLLDLSTAIGNIRDTRLFRREMLPVSREKEIKILEHNFESLIGNVNQLITDIEFQKEHEKRSQLRMLQAQINPHFLFNAMDTVNWIALSHNCDDIAQIVDSIAALMRYSITDPDSMVTVAREMENIRKFLSIYQLRHHNRLQLTECLESEELLIPKFILQPLVENSLRHARPTANQELAITVSSFCTPNCTTIEVIDNGTCGSAEQLNRHLNYEETTLQISSGFGVRNVNERIQLNYHNGSCLSYHDLPGGGLCARITLLHS